jgi:hypothetical protein
MHYLVLLLVCACGAASDSMPPTSPQPTTPVAPVAQASSCSNLATVPAPTWAGWRTSGASDPCVRLTRCAQAGCPQASCLHERYGCLDSGTTAALQEQQLGAAFFVTVACCPS